MSIRMRSILESVVVVAILLVLVQTFLEDFAVLSDWIWSSRRILVITGFAFDLFFYRRVPFQDVCLGILGQR